MAILSWGKSTDSNNVSSDNTVTVFNNAVTTIKSWDFGTAFGTTTTTITVKANPFLPIANYTTTYVPLPEIEPTTEPITIEPTTKIKPSEAIRLGRLTMPKEVKGILNDRNGGGCTLGAMFAGWGFGAHASMNGELKAFLLEEYGEAAPKVWNILRKIPIWYDSGLRTEKQIIQYLESVGL